MLHEGEVLGCYIIQLEQPDDSVLTGSGKSSTISTESKTADIVCVSLQWI